MDYKAEMMFNKKVLYSNIYNNYSHPNQIIKLVVKKSNFNYKFFTISIMNRMGEVWIYGVEKTSKGYRALPLSHDIKGKSEVMLVFSGNVSIDESMRGKSNE